MCDLAGDDAKDELWRSIRQEGASQEGASQEEVADRREGPALEGAALEAVVPSRDVHSAADKPFDWVAAGWTRFDYYTEKASELARKLSLLGFAAIVFVTGITNQDFDAGDAVDLPGRVITAGALLAASLTIDLLHYALGSAVWFAWPRWHERRRDRKGYTPPEGYPSWLPWFSNTMFVLKLALAGVGWGFLLIEIASSVE